MTQKLQQLKIQSKKLDSTAKLNTSWTTKVLFCVETWNVSWKSEEKNDKIYEGT